MVPSLSALLVPLLLAAASPAPAAEAAAPAAPSARANVSFTLIVGRVGGPEGTKERSYKFVGQDGSISRMLVGFRTPIPTKTAEGGADSIAYIYQNVGVTADLETQSLSGGRFLVSGQIEISGARAGDTSAAASTSAKPPMIGTFQQELHVVIPNGKKMRIAEGPDPESGTLYVDLRVDLLE